MSGTYYSTQSDLTWSNRGEPMKVTDSTSSHRTNDSGYYTISSSSPNMGSPVGYENASSSSEYNHNRHNSVHYSSMTSSTSNRSTFDSSSQDSAPRKGFLPDNSRSTPSSLGWDANQTISEFYDLEIPSKESTSKEPHLVLDLKYFESQHTPRVVFLDKSPHASKHHHPCMFPAKSCWKSTGRPAFGRSADLMRHYAHVHTREQPHKMYCDYHNCTRAKDPFTRKDHYRDHLRDYHNEDMPRPNKGKRSPKGSKPQNPNISSKWWRCSKCLKRKYIKEHGWSCCGSECEEGRQQARQNGGYLPLDKIPEAKYEESSDRKMDIDSSVQPYPACPYCQDQGQVWNEKTASWTPCSVCSPAQLPVYGQFVSSSYAGESSSGSASRDDMTVSPTSINWDQRGHDSQYWG